ncbi:MAG: 30S ribosome-binding factor RbfA [Clostridia bacterium]|nr:30S ribosome-binding factor RbfA [Clostridia bacterium]
MSFRLDKANSVLQKNLAEIVYELNDPRLVDEIVTIHKVSISPDLKYAKVHIGILGDKDEKEAFEAIQKASGFIRHQLSNRVEYRVLPVLDFQLSNSEEVSSNIDKILKKIGKELQQSDEKRL